MNLKILTLIKTKIVHVVKSGIIIVCLNHFLLIKNIVSINFIQRIHFCINITWDIIEFNSSFRLFYSKIYNIKNYNVIHNLIYDNHKWNMAKLNLNRQFFLILINLKF